MKILGLAVCIFCTSAFAQTPEAPMPTGGPSSSEVRAQKVWGWAGQVGDLYFGGQSTFGIGATAFYYLNDRSILSIEVGGGTNTDFLSSIGGDTVNGSMSRVGIFYKYFLRNSVYVKGGLEKRSINYMVTHYPAFGGSAYHQSADINLYSVWAGIGNQWETAGHLVIGCDWFAVSMPIANSGFSESDSGPVLGPWNLHSSLTAYGSFDIARFYIGMSY